MRVKKTLFLTIVAIAVMGISAGYSSASQGGSAKIGRGVAASDTLLSGMIAALLPPDKYSTEAILPPGQCPGHYDVKLSDIEKMKKAHLIVSFKGMPFMGKGNLDGRTQLVVDAGSRNWMAPDSYIYGLGVLAAALSKRFPNDKNEIMKRKEDSIREIRIGVHSLLERIKRAEIFGKPIIASSMQKEPLAWMGFLVVGEYGRQESISARELVRLLEIGKAQKAIMVVDNLQSGPDAGKAIAESLRIPHVVLTNFPTEKGYLATLEDNIKAVLGGAKKE